MNNFLDGELTSGVSERIKNKSYSPARFFLNVFEKAEA
ncbi:hypothetical protein B0H69_001308 [Clostridium beijerinckii]|nr:hypothetical protein [Clostridium beijerinckii]NRU51837.1 hypothetical protein [Clostridium beijerinckii]NSA14597.1 hypothetical protein [Clostridium beijerinckii]NSA59059.1 hypothetical protein [Clostridium beijerinckii]NYC07098.1 hypothetical protein [Clostridium beijerinckii]